MRVVPVSEGGDAKIRLTTNFHRCRLPARRTKTSASPVGLEEEEGLSEGEEDGAVLGRVCGSGRRWSVA